MAKNLINDLMINQLSRAQRFVEKYINIVIRDSGLTAKQLLVLYTINECKNRNANTTDVATILGMDRTTLHRNMTSKYMRALVIHDHKITVDGKRDRRNNYPILTDKGKEELKRWFPKLAEADIGVCCKIKQSHVLVEDLSKLSDKVKEAMVHLTRWEKE